MIGLRHMSAIFDIKHGLHTCNTIERCSQDGCDKVFVLA